MEEIQQPYSAIYEGRFESYQCEVCQAFNACSFVERCNTSKAVQVIQLIQVQVQELIHVQVEVHVQEITVRGVSQASDIRPLIENGWYK